MWLKPAMRSPAVTEQTRASADYFADFGVRCPSLCG